MEGTPCGFLAGLLPSLPVLSRGIWGGILVALLVAEAVFSSPYVFVLSTLAVCTLWLIRLPRHISCSSPYFSAPCALGLRGYFPRQTHLLHARHHVFSFQPIHESSLCVPLVQWHFFRQNSCMRGIDGPLPRHALSPIAHRFRAQTHETARQARSVKGDARCRPVGQDQGVERKVRACLFGTWHTPRVIAMRVRISQYKPLPLTSLPVSYTHLTLPTIA